MNILCVHAMREREERETNITLRLWNNIVQMEMKYLKSILFLPFLFCYVNTYLFISYDLLFFSYFYKKPNWWMFVFEARELK